MNKNKQDTGSALSVITGNIGIIVVLAILCIIISFLSIGQLLP